MAGGIEERKNAASKPAGGPGAWKAAWRVHTGARLGLAPIGTRIQLSGVLGTVQVPVSVGHQSSMSHRHCDILSINP